MKQNKEQNDNYICRAKIAPSEDDSGFDFEAVAVPVDNMQIRYSFENDEYFKQVLRVSESNIDISRMQSGLPLFDNHPFENSASNTLGITTEYLFDERGLVIRAKLGARADEALKQDIKNGVIKSVSIEGQIQNYQIERKPNELPVYYAEFWTPFSLSFAPVPNDIGATIEVKRAIDKQLSVQPESDSFFKSLIKKF